MDKQNRVLLIFLWMMIAAFFVTGLLVDGPRQALSGFLRIQTDPARLINDYIARQGIGATLINSALSGCVALAIILLLGTKLSGPTFAAVFTIMGFAFFGKTPLNILPIIGGVFIAAKFMGKPLQEYVIIALFGTALGPLVTYLAFELGFSGLPAVLLGIGGGIITGFFLPAIAVSMLHLHQGYSLYNMGLSCGFFALFAASIIRVSGNSFTGTLEWYGESSPVLIFLAPVLSLALIIVAVITGGRRVFGDFGDIQKLSGRLPSDFMTMQSLEGALFNAGAVGLCASAYLYIIGADFNGPVLGGLLTIMGFGAFGTHLRNSWPVVSGVALTTLLFGQPLTAPGPVLAFLFSTTLGPLAGQFGLITGFAAGFLHFAMVSFTGGWQGGINLYNNGFAGGLTAALIVAVIQWYQANKKETGGVK